MNDPNDRVEDALEKLQQEYMAGAEKGDFSAIEFAMLESEEYNTYATAAIMSLLPMVPHDDDDRWSELCKIYVEIQRLLILKVLAEHVAPVWARAEYVKRREEFMETAEENVMER